MLFVWLRDTLLVTSNTRIKCLMTYPATVPIASLSSLFQEFDMSVEELSETLLQIKVWTLFNLC